MSASDKTGVEKKTNKREQDYDKAFRRTFLSFVLSIELLTTKTLIYAQ